MEAGRLYPRHVEKRLIEALGDSPVVLIHGPRQCGKTTLARMVGDTRDYTYFNFDDRVLLEAAISDPVGFVDDLPERATLLESSFKVRRIGGAPHCLGLCSLLL